MPPLQGLDTLDPDERSYERRVEQEHDHEDEGLVEVVNLDEGGQGDDAQDPDVHQELDAALPVRFQQRLSLRQVGRVRGQGQGHPRDVQRGDEAGEDHHKHSYRYHKFWHCLTI